MPSNINPLAQGMVTDDPRFNERYLPVLGVGSSAAVYSGVGVPPNSLGQNGDLYARTDGTEAGHTILYHREAGAWVATAA